MAVTIEVTIEPVACVEDVAAWLCSVLNVVSHLDGEPTTILQTVQAFAKIDIPSSLDKEGAISNVALQAVNIVASADVTDTKLVVLVSHCLSRTAVGEGEFCTIHLAATICGGRCIDLLASKHYGNGEGICTNGLCPCYVALVVVELIADATVGQILIRNNLINALFITPCFGSIVVSTCTARTVIVLVADVVTQVNVYDVTRVTPEGTAFSVDIKTAIVVDNKAVDDVSTFATPTDDTATIHCFSTADGELGEGVLDHRALIGNAAHTAVGGIAIHRAVHTDINVTTADSTTIPDCDTGCQFLIGLNGTLNLQVLDKRIRTNVAEDGCALIFILGLFVGIGGIDGNGVSLTIEGSLIVNTILTNHCEVGALVDVGCQHGIGISITTIHELSECNQIIRRTNLVDTSHFRECPRCCGDNAKQHHQTQI